MAIRKTTSEPESKLYRSISEVSDMLDVKPHVLRYWETQFSMLRPKKNRAGNRMYRPDEVRMLLRIKELLYEKRYTIAGARRTLLDLVNGCWGYCFLLRSAGDAAGSVQVDDFYAAGKTFEVVVADFDPVMDILVWETKHIIGAG